jgi:hypothetical protein
MYGGLKMYISVMYVRNNKSVSLKNYFNRQRLAQMEKKATTIMNNPKLKAMTVLTIGSILFLYNPVLAASNPFDKIGWKFFGYVRSFGRWACLILAAIDVIKSLSAGDSKGIAKIIFKYLIAYATFTILPWTFDMFDKEFVLPQ